MVQSNFIGDAMKLIGGVSDFASTSVMLVDLTTQPTLPVGHSGFGGWKADVTRYSASLIKIAAMFAAYRLLATISDGFHWSGARTADELRDEISGAWKPLVESSVGGRKDFPDLKTMFKFSGERGNWNVDFDPTYRKNMAAMIGPSSNSAASACIRPLGFQYIQAALAAEGLYKEGGLWLAGDFGVGRDGMPEPKSKSHQAASAEMVAKFLLLLHTRKLVGSWASSEMQKLMTNHYLKRILEKDKRPVGPSFGKLGRGADGTFYDCAVVERSVLGRKIRYAAVILGAKGYGALYKIGSTLDEIILRKNGIRLPT